MLYILTIDPGVGLRDGDVVLESFDRLGRNFRVEIRHCHAGGRRFIYVYLWIYVYISLLYYKADDALYIEAACILYIDDVSVLRLADD